jgi:hypothetical protein
LTADPRGAFGGHGSQPPDNDRTVAGSRFPQDLSLAEIMAENAGEPEAPIPPHARPSPIPNTGAAGMTAGGNPNPNARIRDDTL